MQARIQGFTTETPEIRWRRWAVLAAIALLFHLALLLPKIPGLLLGHLPGPRVTVQNVDPRKLEAIRRQWRERQLLLDKNLNVPTAKEAPKDARYFSDRNMKVEKEQRAKQTAVIPKPGTSQANPPSAAAQDRARSQHRFPSLGDLGVKLPRAPEAIPRPPQSEEGGAQYLKDPRLPEGSENLLNAQESVYYSFYSRLYEAIGPIWQSRIRAVARTRRLRAGEYTTSVDVVLDKDGNLVEVRLMNGSGIEEFDRTAGNAWRAIGRFPNPPAGLLDDSGRVHTGWTFSVLLRQDMNLDYLPPERVY